MFPPNGITAEVFYAPSRKAQLDARAPQAQPVVTVRR